MSTHAKITSLSISCLAVCLVAVVHLLVFSNRIDAQHPDTEDSKTRFQKSAPWTVIDFDEIGDMVQVGARGPVHFAWVWRGSVGHGAGVVFENHQSIDAVAMMWDRPNEPADTRVTFSEPVRMISFRYTLESSYDVPIAVFYDASGTEVGRRTLGEGEDTRLRKPAGHAGEPWIVSFVGPPNRGISYIEFEDASLVFGKFAIDDLKIAVETPIFFDGFETGNTEMWNITVGGNPTATPTATPTPTNPPVECPGISFYRELTPYLYPQPHLSVAIMNTHTGHQAEIIRTRIRWPQRHFQSFVDYCVVSGLGGPTTPYWSTAGADPRCWRSMCDFSREDDGWNSDYAIIPAHRIVVWSGFFGWTDGSGEYEVCLDVEFDDDQNTVCTDICKSYDGGPLSTPTPTHTPTNTPTTTRTPT